MEFAEREHGERSHRGADRAALASVLDDSCERLTAGDQAVGVEPGDRAPHDDNGVVDIAQLSDLVVQLSERSSRCGEGVGEGVREKSRLWRDARWKPAHGVVEGDPVIRTSRVVAHQRQHVQALREADAIRVGLGQRGVDGGDQEVRRRVCVAVAVEEEIGRGDRRVKSLAERRIPTVRVAK